MVDSRRLVEHVIESDPVIKRGLQRGIINSRALARFIQGIDGVDSTHDAILGIIRRYPLVKYEYEGSLEILREGQLAMRSKVADLVLENRPEVMKRVAELANSLSTAKGENFRVVVGLKTIRVTADQKVVEQFRDGSLDEEVVKFAENLVEISISLPPEACHSKGFVGRIATELAFNDVHLYSIMCSCPPEPILLVDEKNAPKALEILQKMISQEVPTQQYRTYGN